MKNFENNWSDSFELEIKGNRSPFEFSEKIIEDSQEILNRFYQKETRRSKNSKKRKESWI